MKSQSTERRWPLAEAQKIALEVLEQLRPHCKRVEIAEGNVLDLMDREDVKKSLMASIEELKGNNQQ
mgnify:CR=1 FL=1